MNLTVVRFIGLFLTALATGAVFTHVLQIGPKTELPGGEFLLVHQLLLSNYGPVLSLVEVSALVSTAYTTWVLRDRREARVTLFTATTCLFLMLLVWGLFISPINMRIETWNPGSLPSDWDLYRDKWAQWHVVRALFAGIALAALIRSALYHRLPWSRPAARIKPAQK